MRHLLAIAVLLTACSTAPTTSAPPRAEPSSRITAERRPTDAEPAPAAEPSAGDHPWLLLAGPPVPAIDARVTGVSNDVSPALVLLSVGSTDGVEKGFHFSVYRGNTFLAKVVVERVLADSAGCRVLFAKEGEVVRVGDLAATRIQ